MFTFTKTRNIKLTWATVQETREGMLTLETAAGHTVTLQLPFEPTPAITAGEACMVYFKSRRKPQIPVVLAVYPTTLTLPEFTRLYAHVSATLGNGGH